MMWQKLRCGQRDRLLLQWRRRFFAALGSCSAIAAHSMMLAFVAFLLLEASAAREMGFKMKQPMLMVTAWTATADDGNFVRHGVLIGLGRVPPLQYTRAVEPEELEAAQVLCRSECCTL